MVVTLKEAFAYCVTSREAIMEMECVCFYFFYASPRATLFFISGNVNRISSKRNIERCTLLSRTRSVNINEMLRALKLRNVIYMGTVSEIIKII